MLGSRGAGGGDRRLDPVPIGTVVNAPEKTFGRVTHLAGCRYVAAPSGRLSDQGVEHRDERCRERRVRSPAGGECAPAPFEKLGFATVDGTQHAGRAVRSNAGVIPVLAVLECPDDLLEPGKTDVGLPGLRARLGAVDLLSHEFTEACHQPPVSPAMMERVEFHLDPLASSRASSLGPAGDAWLESLAGVVGSLAADWGLTIGASLTGGSASFVAQATTKTGTSVVLKVLMLADGFDDQVALLQRAGGRGYARLLAADPGRKAILLEALGEPLADAGLSVPEQITILGEALTHAWLDPGDEQPAPGEDKASSLIRLIEDTSERLRRPCPERVIDAALSLARERAAEACIDLAIVHGDPHPGNLLRRGDGWAFIDPDNFIADRAYDLGVVIRGWQDLLIEADGRAAERIAAWARLLADQAGIAEERILAWAFIERVSTGLHLLDIGAEDTGLRFLESAAAILASGRRL